MTEPTATGPIFGTISIVMHDRLVADSLTRLLAPHAGAVTRHDSFASVAGKHAGDAGDHLVILDASEAVQALDGSGRGSAEPDGEGAPNRPYDGVRFVVLADAFEPPLRPSIGNRLRGVFAADIQVEELVACLSLIARGFVIVSGAQAAHLARVQHHVDASLPDDSFRDLSKREREVLMLLARGHSNKRISEELTIADNTTAVHVREVLKKLGVSNRTQAALKVRDAQRG